MVQLKDYFHLRPFIVTKPLIIFFTILAILFPWHYFQILGEIYTSRSLFFSIFGYILVAGVCLNFLLSINKGRIFRNLGIVGYYISIINYVGYIIYLLVVYSLNRFYFDEFSFDFGFYLFTFVVVLVVLEFFLGDKQLEKPSKVKHISLQSEEPTEKAEKEQKIKSDKMKKGFKSLSKTVGKIAVKTVGDQIAEATGDMIGDKLTELTGDGDLGKFVGKFAEKGLSTLSDRAVDKAIDKASEKLTEYASNKELPSEQINSETLSNLKARQIEPVKIDYKKTLLGILKTKQHVQIEYIQSILKLTREHIIGIIYELVGEGKIEGVFNQDDTEFTLKM